MDRFCVIPNCCAVQRCARWALPASGCDQRLRRKGRCLWRPYVYTSAHLQLALSECQLDCDIAHFAPFFEDGNLHC